MAEATETKPKRTRKAPTGPRQTKPIFVIVSYTDADGNPVALDQDRLEIRPTKDAAELVKMFTNGYNGTQVVKEIQLPAATRAENPAQATAG